jgi:hypothetical protein
MEMLWWEPVPSGAQDADVLPATGLPDADTPMEPYDAAFLNEIPQAQRRRCTARDLAAEIQSSPPPPSVIAQVWVEWEAADEKKIQKAQDLVLSYFEKVCSEKKKAHQIDCSADIEFGEAHWGWLQSLTKCPDGIVIVNNENKDDDAIKSQTDYILALEDVAKKKMFPGIFHMKEGNVVRPPFFSLVRFVAHNDELQYEEGQLTSFVEHLFDVLYNKYIESSQR